MRVEQRETRRALVLSFQNNGGVTQPEFSVLLTFPLALGAMIEGIPSVRQEEKYDRFAFDIAEPLADRARMSGPTVHLNGDPSAAPPESHIFFRVKAGDSQFTTSIKIEDVFGADADDQVDASPSTVGA